MSGIDMARWRNSPSAEYAKRTHCDRGHPFDEANTSWRKDKPHARRCKSCERDRARERRDTTVYSYDIDEL